MKKVYLGVDCGSTSIKAVILDSDDNILESCYLRNQGIIETLKKVLMNVHFEKYEILGCGITGSGRNFVKILLNADLAKSEVLAHGIATLTYYPNVNTIFEIGGEDSKLMTLNNEIITDFRMNSICGGGTGSMLETVCNRMGVMVEEMGDYALKSTIEVELPGKCGIFCQSAVVNRLNSGFKKEDVLMGVCRALIRNYLAMCKGTRIRPPYVFQGMTAKNKALVKALEDELNHKIIVPEKCELMGAVGMAMIVREEKITNSKLSVNVNSEYHTKGFKCTDCPNRCEVTQIYEEDKFIGGIGTRCGKWETKEYHEPIAPEIVLTDRKTKHL